MKYPCLLIDHDDTVVDSTRDLHYPSFCAYLKTVRPDLHYTFDEYLQKNFDPGFAPFCYSEIGLTEEQMQQELLFWKEYIRNKIPSAYPGIREILTAHQKNGGRFFVVSHSLSDTILRDYQKNGLPLPDGIFGWELPEEQRKPHLYPIQAIREQYGYSHKEMLMVDDLKPGLSMARAGGIAFAAAGWAYDIVSIRQFMQQHCDFYLSKVEDLSRLLEESSSSTPKIGKEAKPPVQPVVCSTPYKG